MSNQEILHNWWWGNDGPAVGGPLTIKRIVEKLQPAKNAGVVKGKSGKPISASGWNYAVLKFLIEKCALPEDVNDSLIAYAHPIRGNYGGWRHHLNIQITINPIPEPNTHSPVIPDRGSTVDGQMDLTLFPRYYQQYNWNGKHKLFGYPSDSYPDFQWINSLEKRFVWLCNNSAKQNTASKYLLHELIEWGGSQRGVLQKFKDGSGEVNLLKLVQKIITNLDSPKIAIASSLKLPGFGLTYASKTLRFMRPNKYGTLDSRIRSALSKHDLLRRIYDGNIKSMVEGYLEFLELLNYLKIQLEYHQIRKPDCNLSKTGFWRPSEIEMALFRWSELQLK